MQHREISPLGLEFQPRLAASTLVDIPTLGVRFPYPAWTLVMDSFSP